MSRIGIKPISVPAGVEVTVADGNVVTVKVLRVHSQKSSTRI